MTRLPTPLHRSYARQRREYGPASIPGLVERWPISGGRQFQDSAGTTPSGAADPVGNWDGVLGVADLVQATTAKKPTLDATGPGVRFDMVDDLLRATYALSMSSRWAMVMAVWGRDDSDKVVLRAIGGGFTALSVEYAMVGRAGDNRQLAVPANFLPDNWLFADIFQADWANTDGIAHPLGTLYADANNSIEWGKNAAGDLYVTVIADGTTKTATLTKTIAAGAWVFLGARLNAGTLTIYADTDSDGDVSDNTATATSVPASTGASWTYHHMANQAVSLFGEGASNLVLMADGSSAAPITDRFAAGLGMAIEEWCNRYSDKLVLYGPHSTDSGTTHAWKTAQGSAPAVTRNDTGTQITWKDVVEPVSANVLRNRHRITTSDAVSRRMTLLERAYTNKVTTALASWTASNASITSTSIADPAGGTTAIEVTAAAGSAEHSINVTPTTAIGKLSGAVWVKAGTYQYARYWIYNSTDGTVNYVSVNLTTGAVVASGGLSGAAYRITVRNGWVRFKLYGSSQTVANSKVYVAFTTSAGGSTYNAAGTETIYVWRPSLYENTIPPESVLDVSEATTADNLTVDLLDATPQEATYLYEGVVLDLPNQGTSRALFFVGDGATKRLGAYFNGSNDRLQILFHNGTTEIYGWFTAPGVVVGDRITVRIYQAASGAITVGFSRNGGAEDVTQDSAMGTQVLPADWSSNRVRFGNITDGGAQPSNSGLTAFKAQSGPEKSLATMQALTNPDIAVYRSGQTSELASVSYSVSTSGVPSRVIWSASKYGALQPYVYAALATDEKVEVGVRNDAGTRTEASSAGAMTTGAHSLIIEWDGTDLKAYLDTTLVATLTPGAGTYTGLDRLNLGGLVGYLEGHPFDERIADPILYAGASFLGLTAIDRTRLHNWLADRVTGLAAV